MSPMKRLRMEVVPGFSPGSPRLKPARPSIGRTGGPGSTVRGAGVIVPSVSSVVELAPNTNTASYSLSRPTSFSISRVATLPTPTISNPVANGSSVPAWPTRRSPVSRRTRSTTSWLVIPAGLSMRRKPSIRDYSTRRSTIDKYAQNHYGFPTAIKRTAGRIHKNDLGREPWAFARATWQKVNGDEKTRRSLGA